MIVKNQSLDNITMFVSRDKTDQEFYSETEIN